jgi:hypothetical protein
LFPAEPEGHGRKLGGDRRIDARVVASVPAHRPRTEQVRQVLVVNGRLVLGDVDLAGLLVELLVGPGRVFLLQFGGDEVVVAEVQRL